MNGETVEHVTLVAGPPDRYNKPTFTQVGAPLDGVGVAPTLGNDETTIPRDSLTRTMTLYCPPGTLVSPTDEFMIRGVRYEVSGLPADWRSYYSHRAVGVVVQVQRSEDTDA